MDCFKQIRRRQRTSDSPQSWFSVLLQLAYFGFVLLLAVVLALDQLFANRLRLRQRLCRLILGTLRIEMTLPEEENATEPAPLPAPPQAHPTPFTSITLLLLLPTILTSRPGATASWGARGQAVPAPYTTA